MEADIGSWFQLCSLCLLVSFVNALQFVQHNRFENLYYNTTIGFERFQLLHHRVIFKFRHQIFLILAQQSS